MFTSSYTSKYSRARAMFRKARGLAFWDVLKARLRGDEIDLKYITLNEDDYDISEPEQRAIELDEIVGTLELSKEYEYTRNFYPRHNYMEARWVSLYLADREQFLPPIQVIELEGDFYIHDGHHRTSVAKVSNDSFIDAKIRRFTPKQSA